MESEDLEHLSDLSETFVNPTDAKILNAAKTDGIKTLEDYEDLSGLSFFIAIPAQILIRQDISSEAKILFAMIVGLTRVKGKCCRSNAYLEKMSGISSRTIQRNLILLHKVGLIDVELERNEAGTWRYMIPIMPAGCQNGTGYDKNGGRGVTNWHGGYDKLATHINRTVKNRDIKNNIPASSDADVIEFNKLWETYPRKLGKKQAFKAYKRDGLKESDLVAAALENYRADIKQKGTQEQFIQHGGTWFNNWRDWGKPQEAAQPQAKTNAQLKAEKLAKIKSFQCITCKGGKIEQIDEEYGCNQCGSRYTDYFKGVELRVA